MKTPCIHLLTTLLLVVGSCRQPRPELVPPKPSVPPVTLENRIANDPAAFLEGVYTGDMYTRTLTRIGLLGPATHLLIKRLSSHRVELFSVYGQMRSYQVDITLKGDTIQQVASQPVALNMIVKGDKPTEFHARTVSPLWVGEEQPEMVYFNWLNTTEYRPLDTYRSVVTGQTSMSILTGVYCGEYIGKVTDERKYLIIAKPIVLKQISSHEVELFDINRWEKPLRFPLTQQDNDSLWVGQANQMRLSIRVKRGQPQQFIIEPEKPDTTSATEAWPPLNYKWDASKPNYNHSYIRL